jgi:hypothetical protein
MRDGGLSPVVMSIVAIIARAQATDDGDVNKSKYTVRGYILIETGTWMFT